jgi:hypothetical protein
MYGCAAAQERKSSVAPARVFHAKPYPRTPTTISRGRNNSKKNCSSLRAQKASTRSSHPPTFPCKAPPRDSRPRWLLLGRKEEEAGGYYSLEPQTTQRMVDSSSRGETLRFLASMDLTSISRISSPVRKGVAERHEQQGRSVV